MIGILELFQELIFVFGYLSSGNSFPDPLPPEEEKKAIEALAAGEESARQTLISHNLRLVAHVVKKYAGTGYDMDDLISIGTIGLIKAVATFDSGKGAALATYAARCINNEVLMSIRAAKKQKYEVSLTAAIGTDHEGNEITLVDIMGTDSQVVSEEVETRLQVNSVRRLIDACLTDRERMVVILRYGLAKGPCMPQREVAKLLGISRSYVSRIEKKALEKLREHMENPQLPEPDPKKKPEKTRRKRGENKKQRESLKEDVAKGRKRAKMKE